MLLLTQFSCISNIRFYLTYSVGRVIESVESVFRQAGRQEGAEGETLLRQTLWTKKSVSIRVILAFYPSKNNESRKNRIGLDLC